MVPHDGHDYLLSQDPRRFAWPQITDLHAHAAEVIHDGEAWFITSAGWAGTDCAGSIGEENRGLSVAPLGWAAE